jgi:hypothetical protein
MLANLEFLPDEIDVAINLAPKPASLPDWKGVP